MANEGRRVVAPEKAVDPAAKLYPPGPTLQQTYAEHADTMHDVLGMTREERTAHEDSVTKLVSDVGFDSLGEGKLLVDEHMAALVADARGEAEPDAKQIQAWNEETLRELREVYGATDAEELIERAKAFVLAAPPKLREMLGTRHVGSKPAVVKKIVDFVRRTNWRPAKRG